MSSTLQPTIIAVDDEIDDLFFLRQLLQKTTFSHRFQPFANGQAAVAGLTSMVDAQEAQPLPVVCFLDIKMAAMSGFELLRWIRTQRALDGLPVIMFSSSDDPGDIETARELGAQGYLRKYPSVAAMQTVLDEARDFSVLASPKTFVQWSYRFVDSTDRLAVK